MLIFVSLIWFCSQVIENLDTLSSLQSLFLGTNKITTLQNLDGLHNLTVLSIQVFSRKSFQHLPEWLQAEKLKCVLWKHCLIVLCTFLCRVTGSLKLRVYRTSATWESSIWATMALRSSRAWKTMWVIEIPQPNSERTECQTVHHVFCQLCKHAQQSLFRTFQQCLFSVTEKAHNPGHCSQPSKENWKHQPSNRPAGILGKDDLGGLTRTSCVVMHDFYGAPIVLPAHLFPADILTRHSRRSTGVTITLTVSLIHLKS